MSGLGEDGGRQTVNPPSDYGQGEKKHKLSDVDSPTHSPPDVPSSKRRFSKKRGGRNREQTVSSEVSSSDIQTPSRRSSRSTSSRQNTRGLQRTPKRRDNTTILRTPQTAERYGIPASVAKKIQKHVGSFPNLMDVISTFQRSAVERNKIPTPEENSVALVSYYENIVCLILSAVS